MNPERPPLYALTGIRFAAAMLVVCFHYAPDGMPSLLPNAARNGHLAVGLFFVLSGFVLAYNYAGRTLSSHKFWLARFAPIYPAYLFGFLLIAPAVMVRLQGDPVKLAASGLAAARLLQGWIRGLELVWNGLGWSLSNEAFFYLLFPMIFPLLEALSRRVLRITAAVCCVAAASAGEVWMYFPLFRLPEFVLGIAAGLMFLHDPVRAPLLFSSVTVVVFLLLPPDALAPGLRNAVAAPVFVLLLLALAGRGGFLSSRPMAGLGDASYAIYILQSPVMAYFLLGTQGVGSRAPLNWSQFTVYSAILIGLSLVCFHWLETPARRWILKARAAKKEMVPSDPISSLAHHRHARH